MSELKSSYILHIMLAVLLLITAFIASQHKPSAVRASSEQLLAQTRTCGQSCGLYVGGCIAPAGMTARCQIQVGQQTGYCVCSPAPTGSTTDTGSGSGSNTGGTVTPAKEDPALCTDRCDTNRDGVIDWNDFTHILPPNDQNVTSEQKETFNYCFNYCPFQNKDNPPLPTGTDSSTDDGTGGGTGGSGVMGDCSGAQPGVADGTVDLRDIEYYRQELSKEVTTTACDFDKSGEVDIIDFTNYLRDGYLEHNGSGQPDSGSATSFPTLGPSQTITRIPTGTTTNPTGTAVTRIPTSPTPVVTKTVTYTPTQPPSSTDITVTAVPATQP